MCPLVRDIVIDLHGEIAGSAWEIDWPFTESPTETRTARDGFFSQSARRMTCSAQLQSRSEPKCYSTQSSSSQVSRSKTLSWPLENSAASSKEPTGVTKADSLLDKCSSSPASS